MNQIPLSLIKKELITNGEYSVRRYYVDSFFTRHASQFAEKNILDVGGKRKNKRGFFNLDTYNCNAQYVNLDKNTEPDFHCDARAIPTPSTSYDIVILSEVIEHLEEPAPVLTEIFRLLKPGGSLLATVPFCYHVHADPNDYARYTHLYLAEKLKEIGFENISIEKQGLCFAVLTSIIKFVDRTKAFWWGKWLSQVFLRNFEKWDDSVIVKNSPILSEYTTGYGITATKP
jgi:SAM-dependent methyltransferase